MLLFIFFIFPLLFPLAKAAGHPAVFAFFDLLGEYWARGEL
jgi:hypothetical protein